MQPFPVKLHKNIPVFIKARSHNLPWQHSKYYHCSHVPVYTCLYVIW